MSNDGKEYHKPFESMLLKEKNKINLSTMKIQNFTYFKKLLPNNDY